MQLIKQFAYDQKEFILNDILLLILIFCQKKVHGFSNCKQTRIDKGLTYGQSTNGSVSR